jgi:hypothetical protein
VSKKEELFLLAEQFSRFWPEPNIKIGLGLPERPFPSSLRGVKVEEDACSPSIIGELFWADPDDPFHVPSFFASINFSLELPSELFGILDRGPFLKAEVATVTLLSWQTAPPSFSEKKEEALMEAARLKAEEFHSLCQRGAWLIGGKQVSDWYGFLIREALKGGGEACFSTGPWVLCKPDFFLRRSGIYSLSYLMERQSKGLSEVPLVGLPPPPWVIYAAFDQPSLVSAALCRQLAKQEEPAPAPATSSPAAQKETKHLHQSETWARVMEFFTGVASEKLSRIVEAIDTTKTADEALRRLEELQVDLRSFTAEKIAWLIGCHKTTVVKTPWWREVRGR